MVDNTTPTTLGSVPKKYTDFMADFEVCDTAINEQKTLTFWEEHDIFKKTLTKDSPKGEFIFYEGPPTANGRPGIHHLEARAFKDIIPRYKTMQGFHVRRKAGWDTHGLPVELEVEKRLGLKNKKDIEAFGVAEFNEECKKSVWTYASEWEAFTNRIGYWVDTKDAYVTYRPEYIESVWNILGEIDKKGLLYKDYKVLPWCARCGTALSSHELAQGYADVSEVSVYVKFAVEGEENTFFLAWTTTPWTLPGNVALAVGEEIDYIKAEKDGAHYYLAKELAHVLGEGATTIEEMKGSLLVGKKYTPLFPFLSELLPPEQKDKFSRAYTIYPASFVTTTDGTGIVHTAVMYGQDDFELGTKVGLPKFHLVNEAGKFVEGTGELSGLLAKEKDTLSEAEKTILRTLGNTIFKKEKVTHTYPFCWRCKNPIIYYAHNSWYIAVTKVKEALVAENQKINWEPAHTRDGRFGEWLANIKDWALSRERYWGTPLPVWLSPDGTEKIVVDSIATLKAHMKTNGNRFVVMRHGQARSNAEAFLNSSIDETNTLTEKGILEVNESVRSLKEMGITKIYASPLPRTKATAQLVAEKLGIKNIDTDERIRETGFGVLDKKPESEHDALIPRNEVFNLAPEGGETITHVRKRLSDFIYDVDSKHKEETILIITHADVAWMSKMIAGGLTEHQALVMKKEGKGFPKTAEWQMLDFVPLPRNKEGDLDLHRPYIDAVELVSPLGTTLTRVKEVIDVWFDSGSMPRAQDHYPFENKELVETVGYPADYIAEAVDQTRGWFYTLHAIGVLLGKGLAYKNVISLGHILDEKGKKMSKSLGNILSPWELISHYGVDALRMWMYSVNQPGDSKNFDTKTVDEIVKKVFNLLTNSVSFYELYKIETHKNPEESPHVLDKWILALLASTIKKVTDNLDAYKVLEASRELREFIGDFSQWYVRRSRDRLKGEDESDKEYALATMQYALETLARLLAPFTPFLSEEVYQRVKTSKGMESVHLAPWPFPSEYDDEILSTMTRTREIVSLALKKRTEASIKVRQPLQSLTLHTAGEVYLELIKDEVNVKDVVRDAREGEEVVSLETALSPELIEEGLLREFFRMVQDARKEKGLSPHDDAELILVTDENGKAFIERGKNDLMRVTKVSTVIFSHEKTPTMNTFIEGGYTLSFSVRGI